MTIEDAGAERDPEEIIATWPAAVRDAMDRQDEVAFLAALQALPVDEQQRVIADLAAFQGYSLEDVIGNEDAVDASLAHGIALVAQGDLSMRGAVEVVLDQLEAEGSLLREPVQRIWAGERDLESLVDGLDEEDSQLIELVLEQLDQLSADGEYDLENVLYNESVDVLLSELPAAVRAALEDDDVEALQAALEALPQAEAHAILDKLYDAGLISVDGLNEQGEPSIEEIMADFLPLLGDVALAAFGNEDAHQLADSTLAQLQQEGWSLYAPVQRIWAGERDSVSLTAGLDEQETALIERALELIAGGPDQIHLSNSIQIANLRREAEQLTAESLQFGSPEQRSALAQQLTDAAEKAESQPSPLWQETVALLRTLAEQLRSAK